MPDAQGFGTTISSVIAGHLFKASGLAIHKQGWKAVWGRDGEPVDKKPKDAEDEELLPPVKDGTQARNHDVEVLGKTTRPPPHYTEGTLLGAMENAGKKHGDADIREVLAGIGIGTVATRPDMLEKIKYRGFALVDGKKIISTTRGRELISIIREDGNRLADVAATADLEREMRAVEKDASHAAKVWREYAGDLAEEIDKLKRSPARRKLTPSPQAGKGSGRGGSGGYSKLAAGGAKRSAGKPQAAYGASKAPAKKRAPAKR
jgi:DNA topoisomerase-3